MTRRAAMQSFSLLASLDAAAMLREDTRMTLVGPPRVARPRLLAVVALFAGFLGGCASNQGFTGARSGGGGPKRAFWPPPRSSSLWVGEAGGRGSDVTLAHLGDELAVALRRLGYREQRWFPIGAGFVHGFAVSTRLEQVDGEEAVRGAERWTAWHPEAVSLFWLSEVASVRLPRPGTYRVFLLAFTDLPIGATPLAPIWGRDTVMAGPEVPETLSEVDLPRERSLRSGRLGVYGYVYEPSAGGNEGQLKPEAGTPGGGAGGILAALAGYPP